MTPSRQKFEAEARDAILEIQNSVPVGLHTILMLNWRCPETVKKILGYALEKLLDTYAGKYATGNEVYLADLFLAPQIDGAIRRFNLDMDEFPLLSRINESYKEHPAFQDAMPGKQPDTPPEARD